MINRDILYKKELVQIKMLLKIYPRGLTITDISKEIKVNRNSVARYMDILTILGQVEMRALGPAKVFYSAQRVPMSAMLNFSSDGILVLNNDQKIIQMNDNLLKVLNIEREAILGRGIVDFPNPIFTSQETHSRVKEALDGKEIAFEKKVQLDEREIYFDIKILPTTFDDGTIGLTWILQDITERKQMEEELRKSERQSSAAIEAARALTFSYDIASGQINWGGAIEEITGYMPEDFAKVDFQDWADKIHPDDKDEVLSILQEAMGKDKATAEYRFKTKKGYITLSSISLTEKQDGKAVRLVGILQDITERKRMEKALRETNLALRDEIKELTFFYAAIREMQTAKSAEDLIPKLIDLLVQAMQFPEITTPVVKIEGKRFAHKRYRENLTHGIHAEICIDDQSIGRVSVYYTENRPFTIPHEQNMLNELADNLGGWIKRTRLVSHLT